MCQSKTGSNFEIANGSVTIVYKGTRIEPMGTNETVLWFGLLFSHEDGSDIFSGTFRFLRAYIARRP
jgi:hypothetical protein